MTLPTSLKSFVLGMAIALLTTTVHASPHQLDTNKSFVTITFKQLGRELQAHFNRFKAAITFDEEHIDTAHVYIDLDMTSFDMGDAQYNDEVLKPDWFDAAQFPVATFTSTVFTPKGIPADGMLFDVSGTLIIKGRDTNVHFPLSVTQDNHQYTFVGALPIKRLAYNIGEHVWYGTNMIDDNVNIQFHLTTNAPTSTHTY